MKIGIISDTHDLLRPEVLSGLHGCQAILHAGDICRQEIIDKLEKLAPVYVVRGNNDKEWAELSNNLKPQMWRSYLWKN